MKKITCCPSTLAIGFDTYSPLACKRLFSGKKVNHIMSFSYGDDQYVAITENTVRISVSGVQEKLSAIEDNGTIRLTAQGEQGRYIIKPAPENKSLRDRKQIPANEHLTMQIARQVYQIPTAENGLIFFSDGTPAYITKRFDIREDNTKVPQEDFASLIEKTSETHGQDFKYTGSYEDIALKIKELVSAWQVETGKLFVLVLFNYTFANGDAHLKNFSLQLSKDGDYLLSPAYDLMNTSLHTNDSDFALENGLSAALEKTDIYEQKGHPCREDFIRFGLKVGLSEKQINKLMAPFLIEQPKVLELINNSFLEEKQKRMYLSSYKERLRRLQRKDAV